MTPREELDGLREEVQSLRDETRVLRDAVDELREILEWAVENDRPLPVIERARRITSMPLDPTADDFAARVNTVSRDDLTADEAVPDDLQRKERERGGGGAQAELF